MNHYEERKQARIEYHEQKAVEAGNRGNQHINNSINMLSGIPAGQPVLVGHHSEKGHRALLGKSDSQMRAGNNDLDKASYHADKAAAIANNKAIHSDDPEAITKLREKIASDEATHKSWVKQNAYYKKHGTMKGFEGMSDETAASIDDRIEKDYSWNKQPHPAARLQNDSANLRRMKKRLAELERLEQVPEDAGWEFDGGEVVINKDIGRIQICFDARISKEDYCTLRNNAFLKTRDRNSIIFQRKLTENALYAARRIAFIQPEKEEDAV